MSAMQDVLDYLEAFGSGSADEIAAATSTERAKVKKAIENLSYAKRVRSVGEIPRKPGQRGGLSHRWELQATTPPAEIVRQAIATQPSLATVWAKPLKEAA